MAYRESERGEGFLFPAHIEDYVNKDDPLRAYDAFVDALDFGGIGIEIDHNRVGNPAYCPKQMMKLLLYGYSYGIRSSRKLERACRHNMSFIWLLGGLKPDFKTICEFRRTNKRAIKEAMRQCARLCAKLDLVDGNVLFTDGSKFRADANIKNSWDKNKCEDYLERLDKRIEELLKECEKSDTEEEGASSLIKLNEELYSAQEMKKHVEKIQEALKQSGRPSVNTTDPDCGRMNHGLNGTVAGYNVQSTVDEKHGLIVNLDVTEENNDTNQLSKQTKQANEAVGGKCVVICADAGYSTADEMKEVEEQGITPVVPPRKERESKDMFAYNEKKDVFVCPEGHELTRRSKTCKGKAWVYKIQGVKTCNDCVRHGECAKGKNGKSVTRLVNEETRQKYEKVYNTKVARDIYELRQQKVELPFGHIKRNLKADYFLLRGKKKVLAEVSLPGLAFNLRRMITIFKGVRPFVQALGQVA